MGFIFRVSELHKKYGDKMVLNINHLDISKGEITAIIGPSGAGKSTLMQILNLLELPTEGRISFDGYDFLMEKSLKIEIRRDMAMVFQKPSVFNSSVFDNIAYGLNLRRLPRSTVKQRIDEIVDVIGLRDKLKQNAKTLSGGEAQRVAVARAIVLKPKVLLLDEPTANLDPANIAVIENLIRHANLNYKTSIVIVTHNMNQARRLAHEIVFILNGNIIECGKTENIFSKPLSSMTRSFINGDMIY